MQVCSPSQNILRFAIVPESFVFVLELPFTDNGCSDGMAIGSKGDMFKICNKA